MTKELTLNVHERKELKQRTAAINNAAGSIVENLRAIKEKQLYKEIGTFDDYLKTLNISRSYAHRLLEADDIQQSVKMLPIGNKIELLESHCRVLKDVTDEDLEPILEKAVEASGDKPPTARTLQKSANEYFNQHPKREPGDEEIEPPTPDWQILRSKAVKTFESGMRAIDDLHEVKSGPGAELVKSTKAIIAALEGWK